MRQKFTSLFSRDGSWTGCKIRNLIAKLANASVNNGAYTCIIYIYMRRMMHQKGAMYNPSWPTPTCWKERITNGSLTFRCIRKCQRIRQMCDYFDSFNCYTRTFGSLCSRGHMRRDAVIELVISFPIYYLLQRTPMRPIIAEYEPKKHGVKTELSDVVLVK